MYNGKIFVLQFLFFLVGLRRCVCGGFISKQENAATVDCHFFKLRFNKTTYSTARVIKYPTWFFSTGTVRNHLILF